MDRKHRLTSPSPYSSDFSRKSFRGSNDEQRHHRNLYGRDRNFHQSSSSSSSSSYRYEDRGNDKYQFRDRSRNQGHSYRSDDRTYSANRSLSSRYEYSNRRNITSSAGHKSVNKYSSDGHSVASSSTEQNEEIDNLNTKFEILRAKNDPVLQGDEKLLVGNHFKLTTKKLNVYHYDVVISQKSMNESDDKNDESDPGYHYRIAKQQSFIKRNSRNIIEQFVKFNAKHFPVQYVYDGNRNFYYPHRVNLDALEKNFEYVHNVNNENQTNIENENRKITTVMFCLVDKIDLGIVNDYYQRKCQHLPEKIIDIYNLIFHNMLKDNFYFENSKYYVVDRDISYDEYFPYLEFINGFEFSVRMSQIGLTFIINPRIGCLLSRQYPKLLDLINVINPNNYDYYNINTLLKKMTIFTEHGQRKRFYIFKLLTKNYPNEIEFEDHKTGQKLSVLQYFKQTYDIDLNPKLPLIIVKPKNFIKSSSSFNNKNYLPIELCFISKYQFINQTKSLKEVQTIALKKSEFKPDQFFNCIRSYIKQIINSNTNLLDIFGLKIHENPALFSGYQLEQPKFVNSNRFRITEPAVTKPALLKWAVLSFDPKLNNRKIEDFIYILERELCKMNIFLGQCDCLKIFDIKSLEEIQKIFSDLNRRKIDFCLSIVPDRGNNGIDSAMIYAACSSNCTQRYCIKLQCLNSSRVGNPPRGYYQNLIFEINGKLGGQNSVISPYFLSKQLPNIDLNKTMIIGLDVNHPGFREKDRMSIAAAAGTYDSKFTKYISTVRVQKKDRSEMIFQLDEMIYELLINYSKHNNENLPHHLIIFRDGVSEGQFDTVRKKEIPLIRKAVDSINSKKPILITLIIVQKRHNTRFVTDKPYPREDTKFKQMTRNVPSGTVVDNTIVEPHFDIFYVNSHFSFLGTSKPTKYIVLLNELNLKNAELQRLCFYVCFNCVRQKTPMSLPTQVMYADLCAYKSKIHIMHRISEEKMNNIQIDDQDYDSDFDECYDNKEEFENHLKKYQKWVKIPTESKDCLFFV